MANFDDLIKGLSVFNQGVKQLAISHATNDANEQLTQLNTMELGREKQIQAQSQIGNNLALRLQSAGADAADISATASRLSPSAGEMYQAQTAQEQHASSQKFEHTENQAKFQQQKELENMKLRALQVSAGNKMNKEAFAEMDKFEGRPEVKPLLKGIADLSAAGDQVDVSNGKPIGNNLALMSLVHGVVGRVSDKELTMANPTPAIFQKLARDAEIKMTGDDFKDTTQFMQKYIAGLKQRATDKLMAAAAAHADYIATVNPKIDADTLKTSFAKKYSYLNTTFAPPAAKPQATGGAKPQAAAPAAPMTSAASEYLRDN
jgi:hypothetical protein